ncbi:porin [Parvularcula sp. BGMRC 0090]|uniref:Porin n=2 Tax=Parvularcula maris TaxID=2965077 RepID=A0A9X2LB75_9PROT|nr:porin [Parvularcula maris]
MRALLASTVLLAASSAFAQDDPIVVEGDLVATTGLADDELVGDVDARLSVRGTTFTASGLELGAEAGIRFDEDRLDRQVLGGRYSSLGAGGTRGFSLDGSDLFVDRAFLFARGGFGSLSVGAHEGAAAKLAVTSPNIFRALGVNDWRADPTGLNDVHTVNDFSGSAAKITYMPPAGLFGGVIGNLQLGISYAPQFRTCGIEECAPEGGFAVSPDGRVLLQEQRWRDVSEAALYYENGFRLGGDRLSFGLGASFVHADEENGDASIQEILLDDYQAVSLGLNVAYGDLTIGGSVKTTNTGIDEDVAGPSDYLAFDAGITYTAGDWRMMLGYGQADAERDASLLIGPQLNVDLPFALDRKTQTTQAGVAYVLGRGITLGAAAQFVDSDRPGLLGGQEDTTAVMLESSIRF